MEAESRLLVLRSSLLPEIRRPAKVEKKKSLLRNKRLELIFVGRIYVEMLTKKERK